MHTTLFNIDVFILLINYYLIDSVSHVFLIREFLLIALYDPKKYAGVNI